MDNFTTKAPIFVIDFSNQNDSIKSGPKDLRLEIKASANILTSTAFYCLILHDSHIMYNLRNRLNVTDLAVNAQIEGVNSTDTLEPIIR